MQRLTDPAALADPKVQRAIERRRRRQEKRLRVRTAQRSPSRARKADTTRPT